MMRKLLVVLLITACTLIANAQNMRERVLMNDNWKFAKGHAADPAKDFNYGLALSFTKINMFQEATMLQADQNSKLSCPHTQQYDDSKWETVTLPHDWGMAEGFDKNQLRVKGYRKLNGRSPENSVGWYRKTFNMNLVKGCCYTLEFEGISRDAQVWMNGIYLGRGESGYVPLVFDVTECLNYGNGDKNVITVRADVTQSELWSYEGAGIYRNVWLTRTAPVHIPQWGTFVTSDVNLEKKEAKVKALVEVCNRTDADVTAEVMNTIMDKEGNNIAFSKENIAIKALETAETNATMPVSKAKLWSLRSPYRYTLKTDVMVDGKVVDSYTTRFGIRTIRFDADNGFFLNGERVQLQGVCCHQDHAGVGAAVPDRLNAWRIARLKTFGANAYRSSHNPPTESVLNACDSLGMLVMDEMRVMGSSDEGLKQMATTIRRDRNHPSIVIWSLGNEEMVVQATEMGRMLAERMKEIQHKLDSTRLCTIAMNGGWGKGFSRAVDVQGSNYFRLGNLDALHKKFPSQPILLSEEASTLTTRGIYQTQKEKDYHQAYDHDVPGWGATAEKWLRYTDTRKFIAGGFVWTGFDYGGEALGFYWPGISSNFGILDYCGFPKDAYWYYKAWWTSDPVLHILPHWNGLGTDSVTVQTYTNMDEVELFVNGKSMGKRNVSKYDIPTWRVKYAPGKLVAKGMKGNKKFTEVIETTGTPASLRLTTETGNTISKDGQDVALVTVCALDKKGRTVPTADNYIHFNVKNGRVLGVGNGDPSCHEPDVFAPGKDVGRSLFSGYAQLIVASDGSGLPIEITSSADGLKKSTITLKIRE